MKPLIYGCVLSLAFLSCSHDKLEDIFPESQIVILSSSSRTGLGANDGIPEGQPFALPEGAILVNSPIIYSIPLQISYWEL